MQMESSTGRVAGVAHHPDAQEVDGAILRLERLSIRLGKGDCARTVVDEVSLTIRAGECTALVGESGSGKSLTSLAIMRLLPSTMHVSGNILLRRQSGTLVDVSSLPRSELTSIRGMEIGMIFQEPMTSLNPLLTVGEQISEMFMVHRGESRPDARKHAEDMLVRVGIPEARARLAAMPHELSGGMRQRVMIAMAIACDPSIVIADEPTTALDVTIQAQILDTLRRLQERSRGMLFVSHDLGVIAEVADRVHVMYAGQVVESGSVEAILMRARHPYTLGLVASVPRIDRPQPRGVALYSIPGRVPDPARMPAGCRFHPRCAHALAGLCDKVEPRIETTEDGGEVRCLRWREIDQADPLSASRRGSVL
ncbi:dipeptide ABC transporter ATP binding subunit DppD [Hyphomicrobiales bacterium]|nr:dipeptide ABC transporter ATP binding subunit DppD [Hyphomicrobiales bacterium]CAH1694108.1 dipeptide ABC transporter ATP binding subunit DppD [Hyphomicrobiales bacterium]